MVKSSSAKSVSSSAKSVRARAHKASHKVTRPTKGKSNASTATPSQDSAEPVEHAENAEPDYIRSDDDDEVASITSEVPSTVDYEKELGKFFHLPSL